MTPLCSYSKLVLVRLFSSRLLAPSKCSRLRLRPYPRVLFRCQGLPLKRVWTARGSPSRRWTCEGWIDARQFNRQIINHLIEFYFFVLSGGRLYYLPNSHRLILSLSVYCRLVCCGWSERGKRLYWVHKVKQSKAECLISYSLRVQQLYSNLQQQSQKWQPIIKYHSTVLNHSIKPKIQFC